jgi:hypothetical protein
VDVEELGLSSLSLTAEHDHGTQPHWQHAGVKPRVRSRIWGERAGGAYSGGGSLTTPGRPQVAAGRIRAQASASPGQRSPGQRSPASGVQPAESRPVESRPAESRPAESSQRSRPVGSRPAGVQASAEASAKPTRQPGAAGPSPALGPAAPGSPHGRRAPHDAASGRIRRLLRPAPRRPGRSPEVRPAAR